MTLKERLGQVWGKTTTVLQGLCIGLMGIMTDPGAQAFVAMFPWAPKVIAGVGFASVVLRIVAPPAPSVSIQPGSRATVMDDNTIAIETPDPLPSAVVEAAGKRPDVPAVS